VLALVITQDPRMADQDPDGPLAALKDLGAAVVACGLNLERLDDRLLAKRRPSVLVVDASARIDAGYAVLAAARQRASLKELPALVVVTTAQLPGLDFVQGAADDFILRPIVAPELYARIRQLDWRLSAFAGAERLKIGELVIDLQGYEARLRGHLLTLTHQEFELLRFLAQHRGKVFSREELLRKVWGYNYYGGSRTVDIHVRRLRAKLGKAEEALIQTVRNVGYKMVAG
jgi:DNA-binding response OmpR family regulator